MSNENSRKRETNRNLRLNLNNEEAITQWVKEYIELNAEDIRNQEKENYKTTIKKLKKSLLCKDTLKLVRKIQKILENLQN